MHCSVVPSEIKGNSHIQARNLSENVGFWVELVYIYIYMSKPPCLQPSMFVHALRSCNAFLDSRVCVEKARVFPREGYPGGCFVIGSGARRKGLEP